MAEERSPAERPERAISVSSERRRSRSGSLRETVFDVAAAGRARRREERDEHNDRMRALIEDFQYRVYNIEDALRHRHFGSVRTQIRQLNERAEELLADPRRR
jgi:hypothetical protein